MVAATVPYEGSGTSPLLQHAYDISLDTKEEKEAQDRRRKPEDDLQVGGFERLSQALAF